MSDKLLGDQFADLATKMKADQLMAKISRLTGKPCNCKGRQRKLNELHQQLKTLLGSQE